MSLINAIRQQLGLSSTAGNNFTLTAEADNGTMKLARGNAGETTQDILTIGTDGKPDFNQLSRSLGQNGYVTLPGGLIIQWGRIQKTTAGALTITFPVAFPTACQAASLAPLYSSAASNQATITALSTTQIQYTSGNFAASGYYDLWIAVGY